MEPSLQRSRAGGNASGDQCLSLGAEQSSETAGQAKQGESADAGDTGSGPLAALRPAAFDSDQQTGGDGGSYAQRLVRPVDHLVSLSACQRTWSAMKVEMK